jgi:hypothetical protein
MNIPDTATIISYWQVHVYALYVLFLLYVLHVALKLIQCIHLVARLLARHPSLKRGSDQVLRAARRG